MAQRPDYYLLSSQNNGGRINPYYRVSHVDSFMEICPTETKIRDSGWRFHISCDPHDVPRAWHIVVDELTESGSFNAARVANVNMTRILSDPFLAKGKNGRVITIYNNENVPPGEQGRLLQRIEQRLHEEDVGPGLSVLGSRKVPGSNYLFYQNEPDFQDRAAVTADSHYNPHGYKDPYENFSIAPHRYPVPQSPEMRTADRLSTVSRFDWEPASDDNGLLIACLPLKVPDHPQVQFLRQKLKLEGYHPLLDLKTPYGPAIVLKGDEAYLAVMSRNTSQFSGQFREAAKIDWQPAVVENGMHIAEAPLGDMSADQIGSLKRTLEAEGLHPYLSQNKKLGPVVALDGQEANIALNARHAAVSKWNNELNLN